LHRGKRERLVHDVLRQGEHGTDMSLACCSDLPSAGAGLSAGCPSRPFGWRAGPETSILRRR
jgi:hypothetical protein